MTRKENKVGQSRITYAGAAQSLQGAKVEKTRGNRGKGLKRKRQNTVRPEEENESHAVKDKRGRETRRSNVAKNKEEYNY